MTCPSCGATMRLKQDAEFFTCEYCGNIHFPEPNADGVRVLGEAVPELCPLCSLALVKAAMSGHRFRYCEHCRGMLMVMDVFSEMVDDLRSRREATANPAHQPDWHDLDRRIRCPQCQTVMETHLYGGPGNVIIDDCEKCSLVWLDYGELDRIV